MIKTEFYMTRADGVILNRTYSDTRMYIERDGVRYSEAVDPAELNRQYIETDEPIEGMQFEGLTENGRIKELEIENAELIEQNKLLQKRIDELEFQSGGSVKPGGDIPFDPKPGTGGGFKPKPGSGLTIGG